MTSRRLPLSPGAHSLVLTHPDYQPLPRKVAIAAGETLKLIVDMAEEAVRNKRK